MRRFALEQTVTASTIIAQFFCGRKVRCHIGCLCKSVEIKSPAQSELGRGTPRDLDRASPPKRNLDGLDQGSAGRGAPPTLILSCRRSAA